MNNLYVIAIGGSGERVMRSLILTLASGVKVNANQVIPVFVDNDTKSNALTKCLDLIKYYNADPNLDQRRGVHTSYQSISGDSAHWPSFCNTKIGRPIILNKAGDAIGTLASVIGAIDQENAVYDRISEEKDLIFTDDDLNMPLSVGFVGNPNIGSVVLNSLSLADEGFKGICDSTSPSDGVIVVGSLFGGTGAAGLPLIVNSINSLDNAHHPLLGAVALLPYFSTNTAAASESPIDSTKWDVDPDSFDTKTRAALMYYDDYMRQLDYMYYIGDGDSKDIYPHCIGGRRQENPAHLVELMGALAIIDFSKQTRPDNIVYKMPVWGINPGDGNQIPSNLSGIRNNDLKKALVKFRMMRQILFDDDFLKDAIKEDKPYVKNIGFKESHRQELINTQSAQNSAYAWGYTLLIDEWIKWMNEIGRDSAKRRFKIYNDSTQAKDNDITTHFYTERSDEGGIGIAKTERKREGFAFFGNVVIKPVDAEIAEYLLEAYKKLYPKGKDTDASMYPEEQKIPRMMKIISDALDLVIAEKCIDL